MKVKIALLFIFSGAVPMNADIVGVAAKGMKNVIPIAAVPSQSSHSLADALSLMSLQKRPARLITPHTPLGSPKISVLDPMEMDLPLRTAKKFKQSVEPNTVTPTNAVENTLPFSDLGQSRNHEIKKLMIPHSAPNAISPSLKSHTPILPSLEEINRAKDLFPDGKARGLGKSRQYPPWIVTPFEKQLLDYSQATGWDVSSLEVIAKIKKTAADFEMKNINRKRIGSGSSLSSKQAVDISN